MVAGGLIEEAEAFVSHHGIASGTSNDAERYFSKHRLQRVHALYPDPVSRQSDHGARVLEECIEFLKLHHVKYAKTQLKWIRNRIITRNAPVYGLDTSDVDKPDAWNKHVRDPAVQLVRSWGEDLSEIVTR